MMATDHLSTVHAGGGVVARLEPAGLCLYATQSTTYGPILTTHSGYGCSKGSKMRNKLRRLSLATWVLAAGATGAVHKLIHTVSTISGGGRHFG